MRWKDIKFDANDVVKLVGVASMFIAFRYDIVHEIRSNKVMDSADKQIIDFRLAQLENCCKPADFIKPEETSIRTYRTVK